MSSFALASVFEMRGLSADQFRVLVTLADADDGHVMSANLIELADRVEMPGMDVVHVLESLRPRIGQHMTYDGFRVQILTDRLFERLS